MNITPRPITASDQVDQSRDVSGLNKWSRSSRIIDLLMSLLGWFTIPVEVLLRRDFGQRWFTTVNYYAGFFLLLIFATIQYLVVSVWTLIQDWIARISSSINPFYTKQEVSFTEHLMDRSMLYLLILYAVMGFYHLFRIWWRNRTNTALHSFNDGKSWLLPIGELIADFINIIAGPCLDFYVRLFPSSLQSTQKTPECINDKEAFTKTLVEPLALLLLYFMLSGIICLWLFISAIAASIYANWRETAKLNRVLDFMDSMMDAKAMAQMRSEVEQSKIQHQLIQQVAVSVTADPQLSPKLEQQYPDLMHIIDELNNDKQAPA